MSIFKAYDIRGTYPDTINEELVYKIGRAYVIKFKPSKVAVGRDMRISSPALFDALIKGLLDQGCDVIDIGLVSTPMMYFSVWNYGYDGGLMTSASHNPPQYNGVKMVRKDSIPIGGETGIYEIRDMLNNLPEFSGKKGTIKKLDIMQDYVMNSLNYKKINLKKFKIVIDTANGMGGPVATEFFKNLNLDIIHLYPELDGNFPNHEANPLDDKNNADLQKQVINNKADLGIAFDGDADRVAFIDEKGNTVSSDFIIALVSQVLLNEHTGIKILYDVRCSRVVGEIVKEHGGIPGRCKVGHSLVKAQMREQGIKFAGELSSHFYLEDEHYAEAPFFVILKILELMTDTGKTLSEITSPLKKYFQTGELNSKVEDKTAKMEELAKKYHNASINWLDGLTVEYPDWWFNVRPSNTEPYLRLNLEANSLELMKNKKEEVLNIIKSN